MASKIALIVIGLALTAGQAGAWPFFRGGPVIDKSAAKKRNTTFADMLNLDNVVMAGQVTADQNKRAQLAEWEKAIGEKAVIAFSVSPGPEMPQEMVDLKARLKRERQTIRQDDPRMATILALESQIAAFERLVAFHAQLKSLSERSNRPLSLLDRLNLQNELAMLNANLWLERSAQANLATSRTLKIQSEVLELRRNEEYERSARDLLR